MSTLAFPLKPASRNQPGRFRALTENIPFRNASRNLSLSSAPSPFAGGAYQTSMTPSARLPSLMQGVRFCNRLDCLLSILLKTHTKGTAVSKTCSFSPVLPATRCLRHRRLSTWSCTGSRCHFPPCRRASIAPSERPSPRWCRPRWPSFSRCLCLR